MIKIDMNSLGASSAPLLPQQETKFGGNEVQIHKCEVLLDALTKEDDQIELCDLIDKAPDASAADKESAFAALEEARNRIKEGEIPGGDRDEIHETPLGERDGFLLGLMKAHPVIEKSVLQIVEQDNQEYQELQDPTPISTGEWVKRMACLGLMGLAATGGIAGAIALLRNGGSNDLPSSDLVPTDHLLTNLTDSHPSALIPTNTTDAGSQLAHETETFLPEGQPAFYSRSRLTFSVEAPEETSREKPADTHDDTKTQIAFTRLDDQGHNRTVEFSRTGGDSPTVEFNRTGGGNETVLEQPHEGLISQTDFAKSILQSHGLDVELADKYVQAFSDNGSPEEKKSMDELFASKGVSAAPDVKQLYDEYVTVENLYSKASEQLHKGPISLDDFSKALQASGEDISVASDVEQRYNNYVSDVAKLREMALSLTLQNNMRSLPPDIQKILNTIGSYEFCVFETALSPADTDNTLMGDSIKNPVEIKALLGAVITPVQGKDSNSNLRDVLMVYAGPNGPQFENIGPFDKDVALPRAANRATMYAQEKMKDGEQIGSVTYAYSNGTGVENLKNNIVSMGTEKPEFFAENPPEYESPPDLAPLLKGHVNTWLSTSPAALCRLIPDCELPYEEEGIAFRKAIDPLLANLQGFLGRNPWSLAAVTLQRSANHAVDGKWLAAAGDLLDAIPTKNLIHAVAKKTNAPGLAQPEVSNSQANPCLPGHRGRRGVDGVNCSPNAGLNTDSQPSTSHARANAEPPEHFRTVVRHGAPFAMQKGGSNKIATGAAEARRIADATRDENLQSINLISCYGANGGPCSNAQMLANARGVPVKGYFGRTNANGDAPSKVFRPQDPAQATISTLINEVTGHVVKGVANGWRTVTGKRADAPAEAPAD